MPTTTIVPRIRLRNARAWAPRGPPKWLVAILAFLVALAARLAFHDLFGPRNPLLFFTIATLAIHFFFGLGPAVMVALAGLPTGVFLFVPPYFSSDGIQADDVIRVASFAGYTVLYMVLVQSLRRSQYQSVLLAEIAESRYLMLLDSEADRAAAETEIHRRNA
jgi:K+-sensing histidine kinase KdpD